MSGTKTGRADYVKKLEEPKSKGESVLVAISGGVDSSVAALLLKELGYDVVTTTFWLWDYPNSPGYQGKENACCSLDTAEIVADQLDLPHRKFDLSSEFAAQVVQPTVDAYLEGVTPNPCARCNRLVRFDLLLNKAKELGFDRIATGHYVRTEKRNGKWRLLRGLDPDKDQSYFLYGLGQDELGRAIFPVGNYRKEEIYDIARKEGLVSADVEESQDLCFVPDGDYRDFLESEEGRAIEGGDIVDTAGNKLGQHNGLPFYTVGQRKGLGLETNRAYYVVEMNREDNELVVGSENDLYSSSLVAGDTNWVSGSPPDRGSYSVKIRYRASSVKAKVEFEPEEFYVDFVRPQKSVTPGQIAALYEGNELLGGGVIRKVVGEENGL